jgi:hypothetical protein
MPYKKILLKADGLLSTLGNRGIDLKIHVEYAPFKVFIE